MSETIMNESKILRATLQGRVCYCRIPVARKIIGTGAQDSEILINAGVPEYLSDISCHLSTGVYSLDNTLAATKDYFSSFSTTRLLQILPSTFYRGEIAYGIMLHSGEINDFGLRCFIGSVVNVVTGEVVEEYSGHPVTVLVKLIEYANYK
ncbi:MAG: hypothetical protein RR383_08620 [Muribaculaceae bacterium]